MLMVRASVIGGGLTPYKAPSPRSSLWLPRYCLDADECFTCSIEEDKLLESALAEHWDLDNR